MAPAGLTVQSLGAHLPGPSDGDAVSRWETWSPRVSVAALEDRAPTLDDPPPPKA